MSRWDFFPRAADGSERRYCVFTVDLATFEQRRAAGESPRSSRCRAKSASVFYCHLEQRTPPPRGWCERVQQARANDYDAREDFSSGPTTTTRRGVWNSSFNFFFLFKPEDNKTIDFVNITVRSGSDVILIGIIRSGRPGWFGYSESYSNNIYCFISRDRKQR